MFPSRRNILVLPLLLSLSLAPQRVSAFALNGYHWPDGTNIVMHLQLVRPPVPLQDGSPSWDASAADALSLWNQQLDKAHFVQSGPSSQSGGDGVNSVFFSTSIYGDPFPSSVLAVTVYFSNGGGVFSETDVIFNDAFQWNSYRGPQQGSGASAVYDLHRVALHEFGHVLGLSHPDQSGQVVTAIMNSAVSDLDSLAQDDIDGAKWLYGFKITSPSAPRILSGELFNYQITAENSPSTFGATGLPPGIQLNTSTGLISGRCPTSGVFPVMLTAEGAPGTARLTIYLTVDPLPLTSSTSPEILIGGSVSYQITAANNPTSFSAIGLPVWLTLDPNTGLISGTPPADGVYSFTVIARSATAEASATIYLRVLPPQITSNPDPPSWNLGDPFSYQITASHSASQFGATGLPSGVQLNSTTGLITGTASPAGSYYGTLSAATAYGVATRNFAFHIQAPYITSSLYLGYLGIGSPFTYQITASHNPTSFSAENLPPGLQVNPQTGLITGVVNLSGQYFFTVIAHGATGDASNLVLLTVDPRSTYNPATHAVDVPRRAQLLADPVRPRLYVSSFGGILILDSANLAVLRSFPYTFGTSGMDISIDGNTLYVAGGYLHNILRIDLESLEMLSAIATPDHSPVDVKQAPGGTFFITSDTTPGAVLHIDPATGATLQEIRPVIRSGYNQLAIEQSPDRHALYVAEVFRFDPFLAKYQIVSGGAPVLQQIVYPVSGQTLLRKILASPDGLSLAYTVYVSGGTSEPTPAYLLSTADLNVQLGSFPTSGKVEEIAFSPDGAFAVQAYNFDSAKIDVLEVASQRVLKSLIPPGAAVPDAFFGHSLAVANGNAQFFFGGVESSSYAQIFAYPLAPPAYPPKSLLNVSTRLRAGTGDNVLIGGFILTGNQSKRVLARAIGPSLPVPGALADPTLELRDANGALVDQNDNWNSYRADILATNAAPDDEHEAAILTTLPPGAFTAVVKGVNGATGVALVELFDLDPPSSKIANISTRGRVETDDNVMIGGFIIGGNQTTKVIVRAIGPSLGGQGVTGALANPTLALYDGNGVQFAQNDNWQSDQEAEIIATTVPPTNALESAIVRTLQPSNYTAIVRGKNGATGVALVEVYNLETN